MSDYFSSLKYVSNFAKRIALCDCFSLPRPGLFKCYLTLSRQRRQNPLLPSLFTPPPSPDSPLETPVSTSVHPTVGTENCWSKEPPAVSVTAQGTWKILCAIVCSTWKVLYANLWICNLCLSCDQLTEL